MEEEHIEDEHPIQTNSNIETEGGQRLEEQTVDPDYMQETDDDDYGVAPPFIYIDGIQIPTKHLVYPRNGDGLVFELEDEVSTPQLMPFNGDYHKLFEIVGVIWNDHKGKRQMIVGKTNRCPRAWAMPKSMSNIPYPYIVGAENMKILVT